MTTVSREPSQEPRVPMHETAAAARRARQRSVWDPVIVRRAIGESFIKLDPRYMINKPVMFIVEIGSVWSRSCSSPPWPARAPLTTCSTRW